MVEQPPPREAPLRTGRLDLILILALALASALAINPYVYGVGDNRITIPFLKAFAHPALYPGDRLIAERPFYYTYLWDALGLLHGRLGVDLRVLFLGTYLAALALTFLALHRLSLALFRNRASAMLALVLVAFSRITLGGIPTVEEMLTTRAVATPIALLALLAFLRGRTVWAFCLLGLAYLVHPLTTHFALAILGVGAVLVRRPGGLRPLATGLLAFLVIASPLLLWRLRHAPPSLELFAADPRWVEALRLRSAAHVFPFSWGWAGLLHGLVAVALFFLAARHIEGKAREGHTVVRGAVWTIIALCALGTLFSELRPMGFVFLLQPLRSFVFLELFVTLYLAQYLIAPTGRSGPFIDGVIVVLAGVWVGFGADSLARPILEILAMAAALGIRRFGWREGGLARPLAVATACLVGLGAWACYLADASGHGGSVVSIDVAARSEWRDVQHWANRNTDVRDGFIVPPDEEGEFRVEGERTIYGDWEEGSLMNFDPAFGLAWLLRMRALGYQDAESPFAYCALGVPDLRAIAAEMALPGRRVFVVWPCTDRRLELPIRYRNRGFTVYEVAPDPR